MLLVLALAACAKPADVANNTEEAKAARDFQASQDIQQLRRECDQYQALHGKLPDDFEAIGRNKLDPWGNAYALYTDEGFADIVSAGPDGEFDTGDDVRAVR